MSDSRSNESRSDLGDEVPSINVWLQDDGYFSDSSMAIDKTVSRSRSNSRSHVSTVSTSGLALFQAPQKINCERENTFAEIAQFVKEELIGKFGRICPPSSPTKFSKSFFVPTPELIEMRIEYENAIQKGDEFTNNNNKASGRNYSAMMQACKAFDKHVATVDINALQKKMRLIGFEIPTNTLLLAAKNFHLVQFIMMLYFMRKYPLYPVETIYNSMQANRDMDIYVAFKAYDDYLYKKTLTSTAAEPYLFETQLIKDFGFKG